MTVAMISDKQRSYAWSLMKNGGYNTFKMRALQRESDEMPHVFDGDAEDDTSVWDWLSSLPMAWASELIDWLKEHQ
jgi:hypothetical protein